MKLNYKSAFTLAEVLLTLVIIGVVAAMTLPTLANSIGNLAFSSGVKKNYTVFSQAFKLTQKFDNNDYEDWNYTHSDDFTREAYGNIARFLRINKVCGKKYTDNECFMPVKAKNGRPAEFFTEEGFAPNFAHLYTFVLNDGTSVAMDVWLKNSVNTYAGVSNNLIDENNNLIILIDVNGNRKPNMLGKDVHMFVLTHKGIVPAGVDNQSANCNNRSVEYNYDCTAKMLKIE